MSPSVRAAIRDSEASYIASVRAASVPHYRLIDEQGDDLGPFLTAAPTWTAGDTIYRGRSSLVVVSLRPALDGDDIDGYLVVKAAESPTA
jgi:hypothetical protein